MKKMRILAVLFAVVMAVSACGNVDTVDTTAMSSDEDLATYPLKGDIEFTHWGQLDVSLSTSFTNAGEAPYAKELEKLTGVKVKYMHPAAGSVQEAFNIMLSSGDLPDLIFYPWDNLVGGASKQIADGHIQVINDYMEKYAPAYTKYLKENENVDRAVRTEKGEYFGFASIANDRILSTSAGLMVRKDWLDELGLEVPETMDEIYNVLKAFKEQKGVQLPYSGNLYTAAIWGNFVSAYGVMPEFYVKDGKVVYGAAEPGYKEFLATMNKWYNEGLIDNSFATLDGKTIDSNIMNGFSGMTNAAGGSGMGKYLTTAQSKDPNYDLVAIKSPVLNKGDKPMYGHYSPPVSGHYTVITTACKNVTAAMKYLDYKYTDEGRMFANFGIEGESYTMVDGEPVYTDLILHNPEGKSIAQMLAMYRNANSTVGDAGYILQYYQTEQQRDALKKWSDSDADKYLLPKINIAEDKLGDISRMATDIITHSQSMTLKFIMGTADLADYDKFVEEMNSMGLETVLEEYTAALQRYYSK